MRPAVLFAVMGDVGRILELKMDTDVASFQYGSIEYRAPDGTVGVWLGGIDYEENKVFVILSSGDIDQGGTWTLWGKMAKNDGSGVQRSPAYLLQVSDP